MSIEEQLTAALAESKPTLIEFYASWCPHCQKEMPVIEELRKVMGDKANIIQIDGDKNPDLMDKYDVKVYPTFFVYKDGTQFWRDEGAKPLSELTDMLNRVI